MPTPRPLSRLAAFQLPTKEAAPTVVFVGTLTSAKGKGIYLFHFQPEGDVVRQNVTLAPLGLAVETPEPSYLELDVKRKILFSVNEIDQFDGKPSGAVSAFSIGPKGKLTLLNQRASMGSGPSHLTLDKEGRTILVANSRAGSVAVLPLAADGKLGEASDVVSSGGKPSGVAVDPGNRFAFVCEPSSDKVLAYRFDAEKGKLTPNDPASISVKANAAPRRIVFRPDGRFAYVLNERNSTINAFAYSADTGRLTEVQSLSTLPEYYDGPNATAELTIHPSGKHIYASNRGHNSVVQFSIDAAKGTLTWVEEQGTQKTPRHFAIHPSGMHMAIVNQDADTVVAARLDSSSGRVYPSQIYEPVPSPACIRFCPMT
jgi:6-phosphogluconolactonase